MDVTAPLSQQQRSRLIDRAEDFAQYSSAFVGQFNTLEGFDGLGCAAALRRALGLDAAPEAQQGAGNEGAQRSVEVHLQTVQCMDAPELPVFQAALRALLQASLAPRDAVETSGPL